MKYLITESKLNSTIEKFIIKNFPVVYKVYFTKKIKLLGSTKDNPISEETVINVIIDNSKNELTRSNLFEIEKSIRDKVDNYFGLNYQKYGSDWGFSFTQIAIVGIHVDLLKKQ